MTHEETVEAMEIIKKAKKELLENPAVKKLLEVYTSSYSCENEESSLNHFFNMARV